MFTILEPIDGTSTRILQRRLLRILQRLLLAITIAAPLSTPLCAQLGPMLAPPENPTTPEKVVLGKALFWDEQLSSDDSMACGTCHLPEFGGSDGRLTPAIDPGLDGLYGTDDDVRGSFGVVRRDSAGDFERAPAFGLERQVTARWSSTTLGAGHHDELFWDNRAEGTFVEPETGLTLIATGGALESQSVEPLLSPREMAKDGRTWLEVRQKVAAATPLRLATNLPTDLVAALQQDPTYPDLFEAAFGDPAITMGRIAFALAAYQRTLNPDQTPWDRFMAGNNAAMTPAQQQGWQLFQGAALCTNCHETPFFSDDLVHNLGLRPVAEDPGAYGVSGLPAEIGAFKTPTLRNAGLRPRLFHNGQSPALDDPAQFSDPASMFNIYGQGGGVATGNVSPLLLPLITRISIAEMQQVMHFVSTALTDPRAANALPPFDHPDLRSLTVPPPRRFNQAAPGASTPFLVDTEPAFPGNLDFQLGLAGGDGAGVALLSYGFRSYEPGLMVGGLPWHLDMRGWIPVALRGQPGAPGDVTVRLPIPDVPSLSQLPIYMQLLVGDPLAANGYGIASSRGWEFVIR